MQLVFSETSMFFCTMNDAPVDISSILSLVFFMSIIVYIFHPIKIVTSNDRTPTNTP